MKEACREPSGGETFATVVVTANEGIRYTRGRSNEKDTFEEQVKIDPLDFRCLWLPRPEGGYYIALVMEYPVQIKWFWTGSDLFFLSS